MFNSNVNSQLSETDLLKERVASYERSIEIKDAKISKLSTDVEYLVNALREEAEHRGWCSDYNEWCDEVNEHLHMFELKKLTHEYTVAVELTKTISTTVFITVAATDDDDAQEIVENNYLFSDLEDMADDLTEWDVDNETNEVKTVDSCN